MRTFSKKPIQFFVFGCMFLAIFSEKLVAQTNCEQLTGVQKDECVRQKNLERQRRIAAARRESQIRDSLAQAATRPEPVVPEVVTTVTRPPVVAPLPTTVVLDDTPTPVTLPPVVTTPPTATPVVPPPVTDSNVLDVAEEMPAPVGGIRGLQAKVVYPDLAKRLGVQGLVIIQLVVDEQGKSSDFVVLQGIQGGCNEEAIRILKEATYLPGKQGGKNAKVRFSIPIRFRLN